MTALVASRQLISLLALGGALCGCTTLGPDFIPPRTSWDQDWRSATLQSLGPGAPVSQGWWRQFNDPALDALIAQSLAANPSLKQAGLRVLEARAQEGVARGAAMPQQLQASATGGWGASVPGGASVHDFNALFVAPGVSAAWELDVWGKFKRGVQSADDAYFASKANFEDMRLILVAQTASLYIAYRTDQERIARARENAKLQERSVQISQTLFRNGSTDELDPLQARSQYLATLSAIPPLETHLAQTRNALCRLLGRPPGDLPELKLSEDRLPRLDGAPPPAFPADLLRRRPDLRAAALAAGAQSERIGMTRADLYPALTLVGQIDLMRTTLGGLSNSTQLAVGPNVTWNIFDFGRIRNAVRVQDARFEQALEAYQDAVLRAAQEVDDDAVAYGKAKEEDAILYQGQEAARRALEIAMIGYREGYQGFQRVLDSQAALLRQQDNYIANRGQMAQALIALYKATGGGWSAASESDYADGATRERMKARTDWGRLLEVPSAPAPQAGAKP
jgi:NodT family efflux transporter outer membrane factor (OMF) lipoprotein